MNAEHDDLARNLLGGAFGGLEPAALDRLVEISDAVEVAPGARLAAEGEPADAAYVVAQGSVQLSVHQRHSDLVVATVGEGEVLGWSWLVEPHRWTFDAISIGGALLVRLPAPALRDLMEADPATGLVLCRGLIGVMSRRLRDTRVRLLDVHAASPAVAPDVAGPSGSAGR